MSNFRQRLDNLTKDIEKTRSFIEMAKQNNKKLKEYKDRLAGFVEEYENLEIYRNNLDMLLKKAKVDNTNYINSRLSFVEDSIKQGIDEIFPYENFKVRIDIDLKRSKNQARLYLIDDRGYVRNPENTEGGLLQQLISFTCCISLVKLLGTNKFFIDEAFGAGDAENRAKVGQIIKSMTAQDLQMFLISQSPEVYMDIPHREINLVKRNGKATIESCVDVNEVDMEGVAVDKV